MITHYATDTSTWLHWQPEYRFGVLLLIPPDPPLAAVDALRERYAWSQSSVCPAHISLTLPLPRGLSEDDWQELSAIAAGIAPFDVQYGPLHHYLPHPGVVLKIAPQDKLDALRAALETASCFVGAKPRRFPFSAHMTIAEMITVEQTHSITAELAGEAPEGMFRCADVAYVVPDEGFRFTERGRIELAG